MPQDYSRTIAKQSGVADVVPIKVFTNNCRASLDAIVFQGYQHEQLKKWRKFELKSGSWDKFVGQGDGALVGQAVAGRRKLSVGQKFSIGEITVLVRGVFKAGNAADDGLAGIQQLAGDATLLYYMTEEAQEGKRAYLEKRRPGFDRFPKRP